MTQISKEYAAALFMLACEKKKQEEYAAALKTLKDAFLENPEYLIFLRCRFSCFCVKKDASIVF